MRIKKGDAPPLSFHYPLPFLPFSPPPYFSLDSLLLSAYRSQTFPSSQSVSFLFLLLRLFASRLLPSSSPPEGQLNVTALCSVTWLTRTVRGNESASRNKRREAVRRISFCQPTSFFLANLYLCISGSTFGNVPS